MSRAIPALAAYLPRMPRRVVDGGYYTKTRENRLLAGPLPVEGAYVIGEAVRLRAHVVQRRRRISSRTTSRDGRCRAYAPAFSLARYDDPAYARSVDRWGDSGQL